MKANLPDFTHRSVALWNETPADMRRSGIAAFRAADRNQFT